MPWGEILDVDTRVREVTGSLLSEHCNSAGRPMGSEESFHPTLLVTTTEIQLCLHQFSQLYGSSPSPAVPLKQRHSSPGSLSRYKARGCMFPKHRDRAWAMGSSSSSRELLSSHTLPSETKKCLKQTCPVLKCSSLFQLSTALEI